MEVKRIASLGAGVQSSTMVLLAKHGEIPMFDAAIFADTGGESKVTMDYLDYLETLLPFPLYRVMHKEGLTKSIERAAAGDTTRSGNPPFFTESGDGSGGILSRVCTSEFKIGPIKKKVRELFGLKPRQRAKDIKCIQSIGISLDEIQRMNVSRDKWIEFEYPLVDLRMRRGDCLEWMMAHGYEEPPRSACVYCPYHDDRMWRKIKDTDPDGWAEAVRIDKLIRDGVGGTKSKLYLHNSLKPLEEVDLSTDVDRGQMTFLDECSGNCFV